MSIDFQRALQALPGIPLLRGQRTRLRGARTSDGAALFALYSDPRMAAHGERAPMRDTGEGTGLVTEMATFFAARERIPWVVTTVRDDEAIGTCTLFHLDARQRRVEIGYALHPAHWGRGLGCDAVATAVDWSRRALGVCQVTARVTPANVRSKALLERVGFRRDRTERDLPLPAAGVQRYRYDVMQVPAAD